MMTFLAGLFMASQGLGAVEDKQEMGTESGTSMKGTEAQTGQVARQLDNKQIRELQKILTEKGYNAGTVDGIIGPNTQQALRGFQESQGLAATGKPDQDTLQALAPDARTQEIFGLSPEFGEDSMQQAPVQQQDPASQQDPMQHGQPQEPMESPASTEPIESN
jgi:peptidoglycan hydrolase-like protein with peptidoglycan-binding domain